MNSESRIQNREFSTVTAGTVKTEQWAEGTIRLELASAESIGGLQSTNESVI